MTAPDSGEEDRRDRSRLDSLGQRGRTLVEACLRPMDDRWDPEESLLEDDSGHYRLRASTRYALGVLLRNGESDRERAIDTLDAVLHYQYVDEDRVEFGTWPRHTVEPLPPEEPDLWTDYDPNWREFVGTNLAVIHDRFAEDLPSTLVDDVAEAIRRAVVGTTEERTVGAEYTNIALMRAFLVDWGGDRFDVDAWTAFADRYARTIDELFEPHRTFCEFNSPTYSGVSLNALGLWVTEPRSSPTLRRLGEKMESALWHQIGQFYHAGLRQLCGPYCRAYGMDTRRSIVDYHIWLARGGEPRPFPASHHTTLPGNYGSAILSAVFGVRVPTDVLPHLRSFQGDRRVRRQVDCAGYGMVATAWLGETVMVGGLEIDSDTYHSRGDLHVATVHWRAGDEQLGWVRLLESPERTLRATANDRQLRVSGAMDLSFELYAPGLSRGSIQRDRWELPGRTFAVDTDAKTATTDPLDDERALVEYSTEPGNELELVLRALQPR